MDMVTICMYFYQSSTVIPLVSSWKTTSLQDYMVVLLITFIAAFVTECLSSLNQTIAFKARLEMKKNVTKLNNTENAYLVSTKLRLTQSGIQGVRILLSLLLMLVCMTFNFGLVMAVVLGLTVAYGTFSLRKVEQPQEESE